MDAVKDPIDWSTVEQIQFQGSVKSVDKSPGIREHVFALSAYQPAASYVRYLSKNPKNEPTSKPTALVTIKALENYLGKKTLKALEVGTKLYVGDAFGKLDSEAVRRELKEHGVPELKGVRIFGKQGLSKDRTLDMDFGDYEIRYRCELDEKKVSVILRPPPPRSLEELAELFLKKDGTLDHGTLTLRSSVGQPTKQVLINEAGEVYEEIYETAYPLLPLATIYQGKEIDHLKTSLAEVERISQSRKRVPIAVLDTGIDYNHPALAYKLLRGERSADDTKRLHDLEQEWKDASDGDGKLALWKRLVALRQKTSWGWDFASDGELPFDRADSAFSATSFHGSAVASIAGAGDDRLALFPIRGRIVNFYAAAKLAHDRGIRVFNVSQGELNPKSNEEVEKAVRDFPEVLFVVAAGNFGGNLDQKGGLGYPVGLDLPNVLTVAAVDDKNRLAEFSDYGVKRVHLAAPGVLVKAARPGGSFTRLSGTSFAAPYVANVIGKMVLFDPTLTVDTIMRILEESVTKTDELTAKTRFGGTVNEEKALALVRERLAKQELPKSGAKRSH